MFPRVIRGSVTLILLAFFAAAPASAGVCDVFRFFAGKKKETVPVKEAVPQIFHDAQFLADAKNLPADEKKKAMEGYSVNPPAKWLARLAGVGTWAGALFLGYDVAQRLAADPSHLPLALATVPAALYLADLVSAAFHKYIDSFAGDRHWLWAPLVRSFRAHHEYPTNVLKGRYLDNIGDASQIAVPVLLGGLWAQVNGYVGPEVGTALWFFALASVHSSESHKMAHHPNPPLIWKLLQKARLALPKEIHNKHHAPPFEGDYAVVNGWSNGLVARLDLWKRLDGIFWKAYRRMPHNWIQDPRSIPPEVMKELQADFDRIPDELWGYSLKAYPHRVPAELKPPLAIVQAKWRREFLQGRREIYLEKAKTDRAVAEREWEQEQRELPWLFGTVPTPLF